MVVKATAGVLIIGLLGTGSIALAKPGWIGMMPHCTKLSEDHDFKTSGSTSADYNNKFGGNNKDNLVGVVGTTNSATNEKSSVEDWWEWSFKRLQKEKLDSGKFSVTGSDIKVTKGYSKDTTNDGGKALNQVCKEAYKSEPSNVKEKPNSSETNAFDEAQVWKYCSWLGEKPQPKQ